ncbi:MAG: ubiquitin-like domain-containing protein [Candidatus Nomurabacteria bacterium]|nr:ubiquitin-like domain-containing protein [Candidatus Nomurabacteria bacterium]
MALLSASVGFVVRASDGSTDGAARLVTVYDRGNRQVIRTSATTVGDALEQASIEVDDTDKVEPARGEPILAGDFNINIYRARPVVVVNGAERIRIITPARTPSEIATEAGIELKDKDSVDFEISSDHVATGINGQYVVHRAKTVQLSFYGKPTNLRTQAATVGELLAENGIKVSSSDYLSVPKNTKIIDGLQIELWRNGSNMITQDEPLAFNVRQVKDYDRPAGFHAVQTPGVDGLQVVTYELIMQDGKLIEQREVSRIVTKQPVEQVEIVGAKPGSSLTMGKGVNFFIDSNGVTHRETYYDLNMSVVMRNCGQGGYYTVREDGVKIDRDGYVIIAAHLGRYPRCSVVETSLGRGKVYDTGGFVSKHPDGWDIATDWSNRDGI